MPMRLKTHGEIEIEWNLKKKNQGFSDCVCVGPTLLRFFSLLFNCFQYTISIYEIVSSSSANNGGDYSYKSNNYYNNNNNNRNKQNSYHWYSRVIIFQWTFSREEN